MKLKKINKAQLGRFWKAWLRPVLVTVFVVGCFRSAIADWNQVPTGSMKPTILEGDRIVVNKASYGIRIPFTNWQVLEFSPPKVGEIVVLKSPHDGKLLVKRIVAGPGDHIQLRKGRIFVNGDPSNYELVDPNFLPGLSPEEFDRFEYFEEIFPGGEEDSAHTVRYGHSAFQSGNALAFQVPQDQYFVMGDNRDNSLDSRVFGCVKREHIYGQAKAVAFSFKPDEIFSLRPDRWFSPLR